jgi:alpha-beta hydrolase superfamily lysophospholipase/SAM-dependent methyltransferase
MSNAVTAPRSAPAFWPSEHTFRTHDGIHLFYRAWLPAGEIKRTVVLFHRGHEHSGRWQETIERLADSETAYFAWDTRGHGRSPGERGSTPDLATVVQDADQFARHLHSEFGVALRDLVVLGHSVGAVIAAAWVHDFGPPIRGLILATPAFRVKLYVPFAISFLRMRQNLFGPGIVKSYVRAGMLTHDAEEARHYDADPLIFRQISVNVLLDLHDTSTRLLADAGAIRVPTLILTAGHDWVVKQAAQKQLFRELGSPCKRIEVLPAFSHAVFHETNRELPVALCRNFIQDCFNHPQSREALLDADQQGFTKTEYDRLCSPGGLKWAFPRRFLKSVGRLSSGIRLGWLAGFDSGATLDYIYENRPHGITLLGRLIDWFYLNSAGWSGIRVRKRHLIELLRETIERTHAAGRPVRILDIASGPGCYVLETARELSRIPISGVLRDYKPENVTAARQLAEEFGLQNFAIEVGDAFDRADLARITPRPTIAIVSGLYELFPTNEPVRNSLLGLADIVEPGGYLIYTNQPWHPQLEFIARVLTNREGKPWVMRRRTQEEMDELVQSAGFEKRAQLIDRWGIFTVSLAERTAT